MEINEVREYAQKVQRRQQIKEWAKITLGGIIGAVLLYAFLKVTLTIGCVLVSAGCAL